MIEVKLQSCEANHPSITSPSWEGRKGRFWDFKFIEDMTDEQHNTLLNGVDEFVKHILDLYGIPEMYDLIKDYEVCGSHAFGNQTWYSDFDIQMQTDDWKNLKKIRDVIMKDKGLYIREMHEFSKRMKACFDMHFDTVGNKDYNECYSLRERKLYNRTPHEKRDDSYRKTFNTTTRRYEVVPRKRRNGLKDGWLPDGTEATDTNTQMKYCQDNNIRFCCMTEVPVERSEAEAILSELGANFEDVFYMLTPEIIHTKLKNDTCPLLGDDLKCRVQEVKPMRCKEFTCGGCVCR